MPDKKIDLSVFDEAIPTQQTKEIDLSVFEEEPIKKKEESVVGVGESGDSRFLSSTPDREFLQEPQVVAPTSKEITPEKPKGNETVKALKSSSARAFGGIIGLPAFITDQLGSFVVKPIAKGLGYSDEEAEGAAMALRSAPIMGATTSGLQSAEAQQALNKYASSIEATMKQYEDGIIGSITNGNYSDAGAQLWRGAVQTLPYLAMTIATSGGGTPAVLSTIGTTAAAQRYGELQDPTSEEGKKLSETGKFVNSWGYGAFEAAGELVTMGLANAAKRTLSSLGKEAIEGVSQGIAKQAMKGFAEEGASEGATELSQQVLDIIQGVRDNVDFSAVTDAILVGGVTGAGISGTPTAISKAAKAIAGRKVASDADIKKVNENNTKVVYLLAEKEKATSPEAAQVIDTQLQEVVNENNEIITKNETIVEQMTHEQILKVSELDKAIAEYDSRIDDEAETTDPKVLKSIRDELQKQKEEVVSVAAEQVSKTASKEEAVKPTEAISEPVEPPSPQEAPIVFPEQKEGLKQTKQESVVGEPLKDVESTKKALDVVAVSSEVKPITDDEFKRIFNEYIDGGMSQDEAFIRASSDIKKVKAGNSVSKIVSNKISTVGIPSKNGFKKLRRVLIRFGEPRKDENGNYMPSSAYAGSKEGQKQEGISVFEAGVDPKTGKYIISTNEATGLSLMGLMEQKRDIYLVEGEETSQMGEDFEPQINPKTYREIKKLDPKDVLDDNEMEDVDIENISDSDVVSEAYHKAMQDGSNPELVKAVEDLIGKQQNIPLQEQITKVKQVKQQENGKETSDEAQGRKEGRKEKLLKKNEEADALLSEGLSDIADLLGTKLSLTGEQRVKVKDAVRKVARGLILKGEVKAEQLAMAIKDYFSKAGHDISDELINETLKEEGYAEGIRAGYQEEPSKEKGVVEGEKGRIRVRDDAKDRVEAKEGEGVRATASKTHKPTAKETTTKIGRFAVRVALDETKVPQAVKDAFTEREIGKYNTMSDAEAMGIAEGIAAANTYEEMKKIVFDSNVHPSVRGAVVLKLREIMTNEYDMAEEQGNKSDMVFWSDQAIDFLEDFNDKVHETALTLRFLGTQAFMESFAPFQHVREYQRKINDERDKLINSKTHKKSFETVKKESKKVRDAAVDGTLNDPAVKNIINKNSEKEPTFVPKDRLKQLKEKERAAIEKLRKALRGGTLTSGGINSEALEALGELAVVYVEEAGYVVAKAVKKLIKTAKDVGITLTEKEAQDLTPKEVDGKPIEDKIAEEATEKAAEKLASRIFGEVISSRKKEDPLLQMVNTLLGKFKERDLTKTKKESKTDIQKIAEAIANKEEYIEVWTEAKDQAISKVEENEMLTDDQKQQAIDRINKAYDNATSFTFTEAQIDRAIKKKSASLGIRIDQIVKEFYEIQTTERGRLVDALIEESGLETEQAKLLASAIENRFDVLLAEGKKKIVDKYIGKIIGDKTEAGQATTKTRKDAVSEFLELVNIGAFQSEAFREAYATAVGIPVFTQAHADKIDKLAKEIRRQKEPIMKHKATQELMGYRQIIAGFGLSDIMTTAWYGNVLGNIKTQERNFFGGWTGVAARLMAEAVVTGRPRAIFRGYVKSMREAAAKFKDVWTEGYAPFSERIDIPPSVELIRGTGLLRVLMTYWRYTRRAMDALDVWNATTGKIAFAEILANEALNVNRFKSIFNSKYRREVNQLVDKYLSVDAETVKRLKQEIEDDAAEFGYTDIDKKLILYDKIDRLRPSEVSEQAIRFGIFSTGNVQAYGTLGIISDNLAKLFRFKLPVYKNSKTGEVKYVQPLSFIAAFTKIAGNVGTMSMNFVPGVGIYRIVQGGYGKLYTDKDGKGNYFSKYSVDLTEREKKTIIGMQIAGAVSMSLLWALSDPGDDDDPLIRVTADGTGDWTKNRALSGEEWKEYSIGIKNPSGGRTWISYKYTPMIIPFSPIGFIRDSKKYRKEYKDKNTLELFGETLLQMPSALADMTALSSMNDFMSGVLKLGETAEYSKVIKSLERIVSGFYTPGLYRDVVDAVEAMYGIGIDEPMKGVPEYEAKLLKERFLGRNPISIYKRIKNGTEYTDRVDVYGRKVEKIMPYNDIIAVKPEMNEEEKMIFRHQKIMGNPSVPQVKQTFFVLDNPDGTSTKIFLNTSDPYQDELWHKYIILRGKSIVESMSFYQDMDEEAYTDIMNKAIENATDDARFQISYELNANPPKKIKEWQKARKE